MHESGGGTSRTCSDVRRESAIGGQSGLYVLGASISPFDPSGTLALAGCLRADMLRISALDCTPATRLVGRGAGQK